MADTSTAVDTTTPEGFKKQLISMVKSAIQIELSTIPLYLFAMYSLDINDPNKSKAEAASAARAKIGVVVRQEMLHLALAGNLMTSLGVTPKLYDIEVLPNYGTTTILYSEIELKLQQCKKDILEAFLRVEAPYTKPPKLTEDDEMADLQDKAPYGFYPPHIADDYRSIGEFYAALEQELSRSTLQGIQFTNKDKQYTPTEFFGANMVQIVDQKSAEEALKIIVDQGEGSVGVEIAHYQMFLNLYKNQETWNCLPVLPSPKEDDYKPHDFLYQLARASNAVFCYLLITIEKTWQVSSHVSRQALTRNTTSMMNSLVTPLSEFMMKQRIPGKGDTRAAPPFQYYEFSGLEKPAGTDIDSIAKALHKAISEHLRKAISAAKEEDKKALNLILFAVNQVAWPF